MHGRATAPVRPRTPWSRTHLLAPVPGIFTLLLASLAFAVPLRAQESAGEEERANRLTFSLDIGALLPTGEFDEYVDPGFALQGHLGFLFDPDGWLGVRLQGGFADGGSRERKRRVTVEGIPLDVSVSTSMTVAHGGIGPQALFRLGPLAGHAFGTVGVLYLGTKTVAELDIESQQDVRLSETDHQETWKADFALGGGLRFSIVSLELQYHARGDTEYVPVVRVPEDDIRQVIEPVDGDANFLLLTVGVWFGP